MDLEYLLWLQDLRKKAGGAIENIFTLLSDSVVLLIVASIFIYILIDKKKRPLDFIHLFNLFHTQLFYKTYGLRLQALD